MAENGNGPTLGQRIRAAMALAGLESFGALAQAINHEGLGERTLRKIADDDDPTRVPQRLDLMAIADACRLPLEFFQVDFSQLGGQQQIRDVEERVRRLEDLVGERELAELEADAAQPTARRADASATGDP